MSTTVYVEKQAADHLRLVNDSGADVVQGEFAVISGLAAVADEAVVSGAIGSFHTEDGIVIQASDLKSGEKTFATGGQTVYWNASTKEFSDTRTVGYYEVGTLSEVLSGGVIRFVKFFRAVLVPSSLDTVAAAETALEAVVTDLTARGGKPFTKVAVLTAALATTPVDILTSAEVGAGKKAIITDFDLSVGGTGIWAGTGTVVIVRDKNSSPVTQISCAKAQLGANAQLGKHSTGVTLAAGVRAGTGATAAKGLELVADGTFETGSPSDITVIVSGIIVAA